MASDTGNLDLECSVSLEGSNYYDDQIYIHEAEDAEVDMEALDIIPYSYDPEESGDDDDGDRPDTRAGNGGGGDPIVSSPRREVSNIHVIKYYSQF
jgi:hypothetical protein